MRNVFALSKQLTSVGLDVTMADNGQTALDAMHADPGFELILMDIMMPVMDGYEAMKAIRKMPVYSNIPIIALTANANDEDRKKCADTGMDDFISKPIKREIIEEVVNRCIK